MRSLQAFLKNRNMLIRIILSYLLVGLLVIGVLTFVIASKVSRSLTEQIDRSTDTAIEQSFNTANILLTSTFTNFGSAFNGPEIQMSFYNMDFNTSEFGRIGNKLYELTSTNPLIHSIYLLNDQKKLAFSSLSTVKSFDDFYDPDVLNLLANILPNRSNIFYPRHINYAIYDRKYEMNVISLLFLNAVGKVSNGAMVLNLDQRTLQSMVMNGAQSSLFESMILNKQGTVITHSTNEMINKNLTEESYVQSINNSPKSKGSFEFKKEGRNYRVSYIKSESLGWTFIGLIDYENLLSEVRETQRFILMVTGCLLIIVLLVGGFFTKWIYGPIHRLLAKVNHSTGGNNKLQGESELDVLGRTFFYLDHQIQDLQLSVQDYRSAKRHEVLRLLTSGGWSNEEEMARKLARVGIEFTYPRYVVCLLRLDAYRQLLATYKQSDIALLRYAISNIAVEVSSNRMPAVCFDSGDDGIAMIVNVHENAELEPHLTEMLQDIQDNVVRFLHLSLSIAVGSESLRLSEIECSREAAKLAFAYRIISGNGAIIHSGIEKSRESLQDNLVSAMEKQITDQLKLGDMAGIREAFASFLAYTRQATPDEMMLSLTQLLISTARTAKAMTMQSSNGSIMDISSLMFALNELETLEEIEAWYLDVCEQAIGSRDLQSQQKNKWIVDKIIQHIHEQYADPNLTVESLVEVGGLSMNYMRKVFKEIAGQSITSYLSDYRFTKAKELLVKTDLPANKIGEMVGMENTNYFYVSFKKHCGKTPDHYRKHHKFSSIQEA
ncbi:transcriptional regulator [Paenibacillus pectinilyticus]|uniref:Transcriptional regulator n=1 Tax=Paenibacillus pectinilyticus TaxID=512399 RepID=A0A1C0ZVP7_9BACL|nr:helix-turn-helix domain-containing protein [Paenibacillus pectinilyticus]OCT12169.1 transcriptional regulator [Paenibacillus pectinilyticus]